MPGGLLDSSLRALKAGYRGYIESFGVIWGHIEVCWVFRVKGFRVATILVRV